MRKGSNIRRFNGIVSAIIAAFFLVHAILGSLSVITGFISPFTGLVWVGVALVAVHVVASIVTSKEQLGDTDYPPSPRKKRHLALKWATGLLLAAAAVAHVVLPKSAFVSTAVIVAVSIVLAVHLCVGSKSLLKDLGLDTRGKTAFRIVVCALAAACAVIVMVGGFHA